MTRKGDINKLLNDYKNETGKSGYVLNRFTRSFINWNTKKIKKGDTNVVAWTDNKIYNRNTNRLLNRDTIYTKEGNLRSKFKNRRNIGINGDTYTNSDDYIKLLRPEIINAEKNKKNVSIKVDFERLNNNLDNLLTELRPTTTRYLLTTYAQGQEQVYTLSSETIKKLKNIIKQGGVLIQSVDVDSIKTIITAWDLRQPFTLTILGDPDKTQNSGGFFGYNHNMDKIDLSRYGIYTKKQEEEDATIYDINCICECLINYGLDITNIKHLIKNRNIPHKDLKRVADIMGICLSLRFIKDEKKKLWYGDRKLKEIKIGNINDHYFLIEPTIYTRYSIINYYDICDKKDFNKIVNDRGKKQNDRFIDTYNLIKILINDKDKYLTPITYHNNLYKSIYHNNINEFGSLEYDDETNTKINKVKTKPITENLKTIFFDFETTTSRNDGELTIHKPYCVYTDLHKDGFWGVDCGKKLLNVLCNDYGVSIKDKTRYEKVKSYNTYITLIAHNCGYDFRFIIKYLEYGLNTIEKNNSLMTGKALYYYNGKCIALNFRCSQKLINMPLSKFGKCFDIETEKEIMPYDLYTEENVMKKYIPLNECLKYVKERDKEQYLKNIDRWGCRNGDLINIHLYAGEYCYMDCLTLRDGYNKFKKYVNDATGQNIEEFISLASMSNDYLLKEGCFEGVYQLSGVPRHFIQKCVVGGRCMTRNNKKIKKEKCNISDFDAVSLYPSAMSRMTGFLKGKPKIIKDFTPDNYDGYFIQIKIKSIKNRYNFPLASLMDGNGIRNFTNDIVGSIIFVDKTTLEDLIKFVGIEYDFIKGYYYDEGHNTKIKSTMTHLFNQRVKYKKMGNPIQMVFKELMNSSYGKTILKPIDSDKVYIPVTDKQKFIDYHYNNIKLMSLCDNDKLYRVELLKPIDTHFNNVACGVEILSMSKRIMNEVMTLAEELKYKMYITDTDSIHIDTDKVEKLGEEFTKRYGRQLIGKGMGQFHCDFEMDGVKNDPVAISSIFLGKKMYCDKLMGIDKDDNIIYDYHYRLKGIPSDCIEYKAQTEYGGDIMKLFNDLYEQKYTGSGSYSLNNFNDGGLSFNLLACRPKFQFNKNMTINSKLKFMRRLNCYYEKDDDDY